MANLYYDLSRFLLPLLFAAYTIVSLFALPGYFRRKRGTKDAFQYITMFIMHLAAYLVIALQNQNVFYIIFFAIQEFVFIIILNIYKLIYPGFNRPLLNHIFALISVGLIMISRLSIEKAIKQFIILTISFGISLVIPKLIRTLKNLHKLTWIYAGAGGVLLAIVFVLGSVTNGSKLSYSILGITFQPSEFVKILFVLFLASILASGSEIKNILLSTAVCLVYVGTLVLSKDLGTAAIFFVTYLIVVFVATGKLRYLLGGSVLACGAALLSYKLFYHVKVRIIAWLNPFSDYTGKGYQISQSLFAISTGGWFGMGLCQGMPQSIPFVEQDFIFSAIAEELGVVFSLCFILCCVCVFLIGMSIAYHVKNRFYKYTALGISITYIFQVFLTIGGGTKFIPLTGVTLPLVSYGGSSIMSTIFMFAILQGISIIARSEAGLIEEEYEQADISDEDNDMSDDNSDSYSNKMEKVVSPVLKDNSSQSSGYFEEEQVEEFYYVTDSFLLNRADLYTLEVKLKKKV